MTTKEAIESLELLKILDAPSFPKCAKTRQRCKAWSGNKYDICPLEKKGDTDESR